MRYHHSQSGHLHQLIYLTAAALVVAGWFCREEMVASLCLTLTGIAILPLAWAFATLTVEDSGDDLLIRYGPLPLFRKRIAFREIRSVEPDRTKWIDGWGIHWVPGRGTTYNLWGFDCAKLSVGNRTIRIGTDDVDNLVSAIRTKAHLAQD